MSCIRNKFTPGFAPPKDKHGEGPPFVPVVMSGPQGAAGVEIELAGAIVRVGRDADAHVLEEVLRAVRASA